MSVGETLARARAERGLTVEDVSRATRLRVALVEAMEADDFTRTGPAAYTRGHLRTLAGLLGIDPEPLLADFERSRAPEEVLPPAFARRDRAAARADRRSPGWVGAMVVAAAVVVGLLAVGLVVEPRGDRVTVADGAGDPAPVPGPTANGEGDAAAPPAPPTAGDPADPEVPGGAGGAPAARDGVAGGGGGDPAAGPGGQAVAVRVAVPSGRSWVEVTDPAGERLFAGVLERGASREFRHGQELRLVLGDAGAVELLVDGRSVDVPGGDGDVARLRVSPGSVTAG